MNSDWLNLESLLTSSSAQILSNIPSLMAKKISYSQIKY